MDRDGIARPRSTLTHRTPKRTATPTPLDCTCTACTACCCIRSLAACPDALIATNNFDVRARTRTHARLLPAFAAGLSLSTSSAHLAVTFSSVRRECGRSPLSLMTDDQPNGCPGPCRTPLDCWLRCGPALGRHRAAHSAHAWPRSPRLNSARFAGHRFGLRARRCAPSQSCTPAAPAPARSLRPARGRSELWPPHRPSAAPRYDAVTADLRS